jgi:hypothetical protein
MADKILQLWDIWYPKAGATGIPFARGRMDSTDRLLIHAAPPVLTVTVYMDNWTRIAESRDLEATDDTPITRLTRVGNTIRREDIWPTADDIERPVMLPGGEVGILKQWWMAPDHSEWRWQIELYNHR